ncbi:transcriptional regulator of sugar metabolism [Bacillus sp. JCM 19045]|uniref:DeoR/GlpR family transcriptional regulator of sugar metabolism n=1 Tax=Shouchella xiaoxiensis TaxID=766895 RepID=A0ABS2STV0_9BACI|nr:DeoR/GlpR family DNA-binding transcription regulator [Shouchella xiaoxiensis]MBM7838937.1 DeoR/GlpR family transcriptional regulator of sugar metabolism [Shouchella xiaoxiensis]GAF13481.1 transcriptional regulator of sugar metabolism [Bacillus sp. JCM 19045]
MLSLERHEQLLAYLAEHRSIRVAEASKQLNVTEKTIRLDLEFLEEKNLIKRVHGGAVLAESETSLFPIKKRQESHGMKKQEIAEKAKASLVDHDVILIDGGSTSVAFASILGDQPLTVITNDILVASVLYDKEHIQLLMLGGARLGTTSALYSTETTSMLDSLYVKKAFIGATGVSLKNGLSVLNHQHIDWKKKIMAVGEQVTLLADSTKFGQTGLMKFADISELHSIISDSSLDLVTKKEIEALGINVQ